MIRAFFFAAITAALLAGAAWYFKPAHKAHMSRVPASEQSGYDLSDLNEEDYVATVKEILLNTSRVSAPEANSFQLSFAKFTSPFSQRTVCDVYPWIEVVLNADGMAVSGHLPEIKFNTTCESTGERVQSDLVLLNSDNVVKSHLDGYLPTDWFVKSIRLLSEDAYIEVTDDDFRQASGYVLSL